MNALLGGMLFDTKGERLTPTHAVKKGTRYHYYVSASLIRGAATEGQSWRIPAAHLDKIVIKTVSGMLGDPVLLLEAQREPSEDASASRPLLEAGRKLAQSLDCEHRSAMRAHLTTLSCHIVISPGQIDVQLSSSRLMGLLTGNAPGTDHAPETDTIISRSVSASLKRAGR